MKEIIVAIDFSECSINALEHAFSVAKKANTGITMVFCKNSDSKNITEPEKKFEEILQKYHNELVKDALKYKIVSGKVAKEIKKIAEQSDTYLIFSGSRGATPFEEFITGSTANKIIASSSPYPVITIKSSVNINKDLKRIILPINSISETRQKVPTTIEIAKLFKAEIHVLGLYTSSSRTVKNNVDNYTGQAVKYCDDHLVKCVLEKIDASNLITATLEYSQKNDGHLISIMTKQEASASSLWFGGYPQQLVNNSPVPILSTHVKEVMRTLS